jgi:hypothetical protein
MRVDTKPGYYVFTGISEDRSYEEAVEVLATAVNEARDKFDIDYVGGIQLKIDDNNRSQYIAAQATVLKPKVK